MSSLEASTGAACAYPLEEAAMLWTIFMLFMFAWMLVLVLQFRLGVIPAVILLTTMIAFGKLRQRFRRVT
jgi:hypothetical protein